MFGGQASEAVDILKQQMMIYMLREAPAKKASQLGNSYAVAKATLQQRNSYQIAGLMAEESLVVMRAVFEALIYGSFIFVYILLFLPAGYKTLGYYFQAICWIQLWAPLYAILNFIMTLYGHYQSRGILGDLGLTRANSAALIDLHTDITALAGWLSLSVPYISFMLINKGGVSAFVHLASHLGSSLGGAINSAAHEKTSGNISLGNFSQGNTNLQTMNAYKHNMNFDHQSGQFSRNLSSGAIKIINPEGSIYLGGQGRTVSTFSTDLTDSNNLSMQLNKHAQQEKSLMDSKSIDYSNQIANTQREVAELINRFSNSSANSITHASDQSFSNNKTLQNAIDFSKKLQDKFGFSESVALEVAVGLPGAIKNLTGLDLDFKATAGCNNYNADDILDFAKSDGYKENFDSVVRAVQGLSFSENQAKEKSLQQQISSSYEQTSSLRDNISAHLQKSERLGKAASLLQSSNYDARTVRTQDFLDYVANSRAINAKGRIGYDTAAGIIDSTKGPLAERKQEFLESFQEERTRQAVEYFATHEIKDKIDLENAFNDLNKNISMKKPQLDHSSLTTKAHDIVFDDNKKDQIAADFSSKRNHFEHSKIKFDEEALKK